MVWEGLNELTGHGEAAGLLIWPFCFWCGVGPAKSPQKLNCKVRNCEVQAGPQTISFSHLSAQLYNNPLSHMPILLQSRFDRNHSICQIFEIAEGSLQLPFPKESGSIMVPIWSTDHIDVNQH